MADRIIMQQNTQSHMRDPELCLQIEFAKQRSHEVWTEAHVVFMIPRSCSNNYYSKLLKGKGNRKVFFNKQQDKTKLMCNVRQNNKFIVFEKSYNGVPNHLQEQEESAQQVSTNF